MKIESSLSDNVLIIKPVGELNVLSSGELEEYYRAHQKGATALVFDMEGVDAISSAGLRLLLKLQLEMRSLNGMKLRNLQEQVEEVFKLTGFYNTMEIE